MNEKSSPKNRVDLERCPECGGHAYDSDGRCMNCGHIEPFSRSNEDQYKRVGSGEIDAADKKTTSTNQSDPDPQSGLLVCPRCSQSALFWNRHAQIYKCVNPNCKQVFTADEYKNRHVQAQPDMPGITERIAPSAPIVEIEEKVESGVTEPTQHSAPIVEIEEEVESGITEPIPPSVPVNQTEGEGEHGVTEPIPSGVSIIDAEEKIEPDTTEPIPAGEPIIDAKEKVESGVPITAVQNGVTAGAKKPKQQSRNFALLAVCVLVLGVIILGVFMVQKSGRVNELSSQLDNSSQALTESQTQLAASQKDVEGLRTQLTAAQQEIKELVAKLYALSPLTASEPFVYSGNISGGGTLSFPISMKQFEKVEGKVSGGLQGLVVYIQDPEGGMVIDLGLVSRSNFTFTAQTSGIFTIVIKEPSGDPSRYTLQYVIYQLP
jgi:hypothetical protein